MNPTELTLLRRSCWLTREQAGKFFSMSERSWRYLEDGTRAIPDDMQVGMLKLDALLNAMADAVWDQHFNDSAGPDGWKGVHIVLMVYASDADLHAARSDMAGYPAELQAAAIDRARILLEGEGATVRVVAFRPDEYRAWIAARAMPDDAASRAAWAAAFTDPPPRIGARQAHSGEDFTK
ncbi:MAG: hypothetical protein WCA45_04960 [Thiobacillaceae bacterium]